MGSGTLLKKAIEKYGVDNFTKTVLKVCESEKEAYDIEKLYVENCKAWENNMYYNLRSGGLGGSYNISSETRIKLQNASLKSSKMKGLKHSYDSRKKIGNKSKEIWSSVEYKDKMRELRKGRKHSDETKEKLRSAWTEERREEASSRYQELWKNEDYRDAKIKAQKERWKNEEYRENFSRKMKGKLSGENNPMYGRRGEAHPNFGKGTTNKSVICLNTLEVFKSIKDAQEKYSIFAVSECCRGKRKSAGKINGERAKWMYYEDYIKINPSK